jgi:hypothetical protein
MVILGIDPNLPISSRSTFRPEKTYSFKHWDTLLVSFAFLSFSKDFIQSSVLRENSSIVGTECALQLCANIYDARMTDGQFQQNSIPSTWRRVASSYQASIISMANFYTQNITRQAINWALHSSENFSATFETASKAISLQIHNLNGTAVLAKSQGWEQYIHIRWPFLSFSAVIFFASTVFATRTIWDSRRLNLQPLKASSLSLLLHGLDYEIVETLRTTGIPDVHHVIIKAENVDGGLVLRSGESK